MGLEVPFAGVVATVLIFAVFVLSQILAFVVADEVKAWRARKHPPEA